jgi:hypothetical protein
VDPYRIEGGKSSFTDEETRDIIDTEPSYGDVNKMLLGSFVEEYDEDDEDEAGKWMSTGRLMESPRTTFHQLSSPARTSTSGPFSPLSPGPELVLPTINTHIPPTRQQTRDSPLLRSSNGGRHDPFGIPHITQYPRHEAP